jgi:PAS domain S-box-containing protein
MDSNAPLSEDPSGTASVDPQPPILADEGGDSARPWTVGLPLLFLFLALLALALIPAYLGRDVSAVGRQIQEVLAPAENLVATIESSQVRRMAAFQAFLLTGEGRFRQRYRAARSVEEGAFEDLRPLTNSLDLRVREQVARAWPLSFNWHLRHLPVLNEEVPREEYLEELGVEQASYEEVLSATRDLQEALAEEVVDGRERMVAAQALQTRVTQGLVVVGLLATFVVLLLAARLRGLIKEAESRKREAVRARREADALLGATGDGVLGVGPDGVCTFLNRAGADLLGYPTRLVVGRDVHDLLHHSREDGTPYPREECPVLRALETGVTVSVRNETLWRARRIPFPVQISVRPLRDGTEIRGAVLTFADMTETRAAEETLRQAVRTRDEVMAVVSHDLRNPVGTIFSTASMLLEINLPEESQREHLRAVKRSAERVNRLIRDLLDVARMEAGFFSVDREWVGAGEILDEVVGAHRRRAEEGRVELSVRLRHPGLRVWVDRDRVIQALTNLLQNALKFTPGDGTITLGASEAEGDPQPGSVFWVSDTGPGIDPSDQTRLFDRFWQVSRRDKRGAGLGLSIVKGIVEAHGGRVGVVSEVGKGSTFYLLLPDPSDEVVLDSEDGVLPDPANEEG